MMTSSGSGAYRVGGLLSSSNLSPLAPPFKVDKSLSKQNSTNPSVNFVDGPVYGSCFDPAPGQFWTSSTSSSAVPKCVATESVVINTNCSSSPSIYGYVDPQSSTSQAGMYYGSGNNVTQFDPFSYDPFPNSMPTMPSNANEAGKSYFVPYVSPPSQKDGYLSLGVGSEPSYDLLSYSGSTHMSGSIPSQVDQQGLPSDGGYKSKWGSFWSAFGESEHGKWTDFVQGCASKELNSSNFSSNKSPIFVDGTNKGQPFGDINIHPVVGGSNVTRPLEDVGNQSHLNKGPSLTQDLGLHGKASTIKDNCFDIFGGACNLGGLGVEHQISNSLSECSEKRTSVSTSLSKEKHRLQEPVFESISTFCTSQKATVTSPDAHFREPGYFMFGSSSNNTTFPKSMTELPYGGTSLGIDSVDQTNTTRGFDFGSKRHSSIRIRKPVSSSTAFSSQTGEIDGNSKLEMKSSPQQPHQSNLDGSNTEGSNVEAVYSIEKNSSVSDGHNPAEDSPCWKGASSHRFSPFSLPESVDSDVLVKKIDSCKDFSSEKSSEATSLEKPPLTNPKLCQFDLNSGDGLQFTEDLSEESGNGTCVVEENPSGLPSNNENKLSNLVSGNKACLKEGGEGSNSGIDVNLVLRKMMSLSETFRSYCFSNRGEVSEKQVQGVKQILCDLNASMLMISGETIASNVSSPPDNKLFLKDFPVVQMVNDAEVLAASLKLGGTTEEFLDYFSSKDDENSFEDANMTQAVKKLISKDFQEENIDKQKLLYKNLWLEAEASLCTMTAKARFLRMKTEMTRSHDGDKDNPTSSNVPMDLHKDIELPNDNYPKPTTINHIKVFNDLKSQDGRVDSEESEKSTSTTNKTSFSSLNNSKEKSCSTSHANDVDTCVMARYQILKNREFDIGNTCLPSGTNIKENNIEIPVFGGYQILNSQDDNPGCPNYEAQQSPGDENYLPENDFLNKVLEDSGLSNSLGVSADSEASVMARFRLIQTRVINNSNFQINDSASVEDGNVKKTLFGPYPQINEDENVNNFEIGVDELAFDPSIVMNNKIFEGWYDNDCSSSDWEHISGRDV